MVAQSACIPSDITVVGAGPVGLVTAHLFAKLGFSVLLVEQRLAQREHSRAIGIHPVSLEALAPLGLAEPLVAAGVAVGGGLALRRMGQPLGTLRLDTLPGPFPFVLSLPQQQTEAILERHLADRPNVLIQRGFRLVALAQQDEEVRATFAASTGDAALCTCSKLLVGCDGKESAVRELSCIPYGGAPYADRFIMGDFEDNTPFGTDAAIFLHPAGLIESFPLPAQRRRWVVRLDEAEGLEAGPEEGSALRAILEAAVSERIGHSLERTSLLMLSRFGVQHFLAERFHLGRIVIAGDAAHVVSPIGGQGMNLGVLDAARLASAIGPPSAGLLDRPAKLARRLARYEGQSKAIARKATRRSGFFMALGQQREHPAARDALIRLLLSRPFARTSARLFTMRGLAWTPL